MGSKTSTVGHHGAGGPRVVPSKITSVFDDIRLPCFGSRGQSARAGCSPCEGGFSLVLRQKSAAVTSRALCRTNLRSTMRRKFSCPSAHSPGVFDGELSTRAGTAAASRDDLRGVRGGGAEIP